MIEPVTAVARTWGAYILRTGPMDASYHQSPATSNVPREGGQVTDQSEVADG
jgi:hypothetical protein